MNFQSVNFNGVNSSFSEEIEVKSDSENPSVVNKYYVYPDAIGEEKPSQSILKDIAEEESSNSKESKESSKKVNSKDVSKTDSKFSSFFNSRSSSNWSHSNGMENSENNNYKRFKTSDKLFIRKIFNKGDFDLNRENKDSRTICLNLINITRKTQNPLITALI